MSRRALNLMIALISSSRPPPTRSLRGDGGGRDVSGKPFRVQCTNRRPVCQPKNAFCRESCRLPRSPGSLGLNQGCASCEPQKFRPMLRLAVPMTLTEFGWITIGFVDSLMVGAASRRATAIGRVFSAPSHLRGEFSLLRVSPTCESPRWTTFCPRHGRGFPGCTLRSGVFGPRTRRARDG